MNHLLLALFFYCKAADMHTPSIRDTRGTSRNAANELVRHEEE